MAGYNGDVYFTSYTDSYKLKPYLIFIKFINQLLESQVKVKVKKLLDTKGHTIVDYIKLQNNKVVILRNSLVNLEHEGANIYLFIVLYIPV
jgi:hypothetical protein